MKILENKVALVTGGGMGIGREIALAYASEGAKVVVADINAKAGNDVLAELTKKGCEAIFIKVNIANPAEQESLVKETVKHFGGLHIACNNAAISAPAFSVIEYPLDVWDKVLSITRGSRSSCRWRVRAIDLTLRVGEGGRSAASGADDANSEGGGAAGARGARGLFVDVEVDPSRSGPGRGGGG